MAFLQEAQNSLVLIIGIVAMVIGLTTATISIVTTVKHNRPATKEERTEERDRKRNVEISADDYLEEMETRGNALVAVRNVIYSVGEDSQIPAGLYTLASAIGDGNGFKVRLNGLVRSCEDGTKVALAEGDTFCAVSGSVLIEKI